MSEKPDASSPPTNSDAPAEPAPFNPADWAEDDAPADMPAEQADPDNASVEGEEGKPAEAAAEDDQIGDDPEPEDGDEPPEFWSAERKALWTKVTDPEVRAAIRDHVRDVSVATARKLEENAGKVRAAEEGAKAALVAQERDVQWWADNGPLVQQIIEGEFAHIDWNKLSAENPAAWAQAKQAKEQRDRWLQGIVQRHVQGQEQIKARQQRVEQEARVAEHQKLATRYPKEFGTTEAAQRTYDVLSQYLAKNGIPGERIRQVYEAPIVEIVRKAYKYDQLQAKAREVTIPKPLAQPASKTPTRIVPGASQRQANPQDEATRQAMERLRSGGRLTREEAAAAFR